ncbi:helix-turn-helix domain-containing protein [Novosphingobium sp. RD2P27]|uniref:Helix-turn-helix domain-containing protein n=1 Tax=Novosphingobium kalidii TaxID=3230299 RepID=A0ABV2D227_9SPHN
MTIPFFKVGGVMVVSSESTGPNARVIEVMNFLAAHPTESFSLGEIASRLNLSNGSAHRVLTALSDARYLTRHPKHKTYSLGLVMVAIGQAALTQHRDVELVRQEAGAVAAQLKVQCLAATIASSEMLVVACEGTPSTFAPAIRVGERWPFVPPLGMSFIAWADEDTQKDYLARAPAALNDQAHERLAVSLKLFRDRGYGMAGDGPVIRALKRFTSRPARFQSEEAYWAGLTQLVSEISEAEVQLVEPTEAVGQGVSYITAPVFSPKGEVAYEMSISGFAPGLSRHDVERAIEHLRGAAARVTLQINGSAPWERASGSVRPAEPSRRVRKPLVKTQA